METEYIEKDCVVTAQGKSFEAGGAVVFDNYLIAYPAKDGELKDWHGNVIGFYRVISSRPAVFFRHHSWQGSRYYYMRATVNYVHYSIRGFGIGTVAKGKRVK